MKNVYRIDWRIENRSDPESTFIIATDFGEAARKANKLEEDFHNKCEYRDVQGLVFVTEAVE